MARKPFVNYGKPDKPKKDKPGVKLIQPIIIEWALAKTLVEAKAMKPPTVPKMESMEKWILARGWDLAIEHDKNLGLTVASIVCPGLDSPLTFTGSDSTMALATAKAIGEAFTKGPRQKSFTDDSSDDFDDDANEPDRPSNGQASFIESQDPIGDEHRRIATDPPISSEPENLSGTLETNIPELSEVLADRSADEAPAVDNWRFLFIVDPADGELWKSILPTDIETHIIEFETGETDGAPNDFDRGWYIDPRYIYDHRTGTITASDDHIVWVRYNAQRERDESIARTPAVDAANELILPDESTQNAAVDFLMDGMSTAIETPEKPKKDKAPKVSNRTAAEAEALNKAGVADSGEPF